jgi:phosphonate transport system permease protein
MSLAVSHPSPDRPSGLPPVRPHIQAPVRDPAFAARVFWLGLALVFLWPLGVATEFRLWVLWEPENRKVTANFVRSFWPLVVNAEFMQMVVRETCRTVAMATAGVTLALVLAVPLSLLATRVLSLSALSGRMDRWPALLRWCVRATLIVLRSIPELIWALVFVRVVGLGPTAGVLAIALTYGGMLGKVYAEILESGESHATQSLMRNGSGRLQAFVYALLPSHAAELASYTVYRLSLIHI